MGIPAFFRWVSAKFPKIMVPAVEEVAIAVDGEAIPIDLLSANPNGVEFDCLYLDLNGLVHPCCHPESGPLPKDEEEMMLAIFETIDEVMNVVRPRRLLYMAMDGVAPRAKMNQQRGRRFKAAKDSQMSRAVEAEVRDELLKAGIQPPPPRPPSWDHNVITPGTPFMDNLSAALKWYIHQRMNTEPLWQNIKVTLSDSNVPGEGEHKIAHFIRQMRLQPGYDADTRHCLLGLDADLIMLALASHEPYFTICRDHIDFKNPQQKGRNKEEEPPGTSNYDFLHINVLREYLAEEFGSLRDAVLPFPYNFERCVDDFVFLCFFVGNDFLPHLPSLEIREGALDDIIEHYIVNLPQMGGYLTDEGEVDMVRVCTMLRMLGKKEEQLLKDRIMKERAMKQRGQRRQNQVKQEKQQRKDDLNKEMVANKTANYTADELLQEIFQLRKEDLEQVEGKQPDTIRFGEPGWKTRYYMSKFDAKNEADIHNKAREATKAYFDGLLWVFRYYYQGCCSWGWYYPFHYSPFPSDLSDHVDTKQVFEHGLGAPFLPFEQLMSVLPAASKKALPTCYHPLMEAPDSSVIDFYPKDFPVDTEGKRFSWQGVVILPWIDQKRLLTAIKPVEPLLSEEERRRNSLGCEYIFTHETFPFGKWSSELYRDNPLPAVGEPLPKRPRVEGGPCRTLRETLWAGTVIPPDVGKQSQIYGTATLTSEHCPVGQTYEVRRYESLKGKGGVVVPIPNNRVLMVAHELPTSAKHVPRLLPGVTPPFPVLDEVDKIPAQRAPGYGHGFGPANSALQRGGGGGGADDDGKHTGAPSFPITRPGMTPSRRATVG